MPRGVSPGEGMPILVEGGGSRGAPPGNVVRFWAFSIPFKLLTLKWCILVAYPYYFDSYFEAQKLRNLLMRANNYMLWLEQIFAPVGACHYGI